jgi:stearoyl-CoA 9-desaturase NADPH oxidoreductase
MMDQRDVMARWKAPAERAARRLLLYRQAEFWLARMDPLRSLGEIRAKVVGVVPEARDVKTFELRPNAHWRGYSAGQHAAVEVEIDGARARRVYSISSAPSAPRLAITVKRVPGGRVSSWLHDHVRPGHVLGLGPATGRFVLPEPPPARLLLLSGGSGVTPLMSLLRDLSARGPVPDVAFVHYARRGDGIIFERELRALAARHPELRLFLRLTGEGGQGRFCEEQLAALVPDFASRSTYLCGPPGLMDQVEAMWRRAGATGRLVRESFGLAPGARLPSDSASGSGACRVRLARSGRSHIARRGSNLLEALEGAGERPASGCRIGICQTCTCRKREGRVKNLVTGVISSARDEEIQPCISAPYSNVELDL